VRKRLDPLLLPPFSFSVFLSLNFREKIERERERLRVREYQEIEKHKMVKERRMRE